MRRTAPASRIRLICLVVCLSLLSQIMLPARAVVASDGGGTDAVKTKSPVGVKAAQQVTDTQPADLPDLDAARSLPSYEPQVVAPIPSTRRRCTPRNPRCNDDIDGIGQPSPTPTPSATPSATPTPFPTQSPTPFPSPIQTPTPFPSPVQTPAPSPSATPSPAPTPAPSATPSPTPMSQTATPPSLASFTSRSLLVLASAAISGGHPMLELPLLDYYAGDGYSISDSTPGLLTQPVAAARRPATFFQSASYSAVNDFSATQNPSGTWGYGYRTSGGAYASLTNNNNIYGLQSGMHTWYLPNSGWNLPAIFHNGTGASATYGSITQPTDELNLHPGASGERSIVRWTALSAMTVQVAGRFEGLDSQGASSDTLITHNGTQIFAANVTGSGVGSRQTFSLARTVVAGDTIEFSVGYGTNGVVGDSTGLAATITQTSQTNGTGTGLTARYYDNLDFTSYKLTRTDATVDFDWGNGAPAPAVGPEEFSVRWTGMVVPRYTEAYTFYTTSDDGVRLWIDGQLVLDKWFDQAATEWSAPAMTLQAGRAYSVKMEFYDRFWGAVAKLKWSSASQAKEIVPQTQLYGCWKSPDQYARDFYQGALFRQPSSSELQDWTNRLMQAQGEDQLVAEAQGLGAQVFTSAEYVSRNRTDQEYVSDLYGAYMQRTPDQSGLSYWTGVITQCGSDQTCRATKKAEVRAAFDGSGEFQDKVRRLCGTSAAADDNGGMGYNFSTARLDPDNRTGGGGADPLSRNYSFSIPLLSLPGRAGLDLGLSLSYNSLVWTKDAGGVTFDADEGFPGPGFRLGFPVIQPKFVNPQIQQAGQPARYSYLLVTPSGGHVELRQTAAAGVYESADSSYLQLTENGELTLLSTDGTRLSFYLLNGQYRCYRVKDRNGNYISVGYYGDGRIDKVTDTLGRTITFNYDQYGNIQKITQPWQRETEATPNPTQDELHEWATFGYTNLPLQPLFSNLAVMGEQSGSVIPFVTQLGMEDGSFYRFEYNGWGQIWKATHYAADSRDAQGQPDTSHALSSTWLNLPGAGASQGGAGSVAATPQSDCPRFTEERTWVENGVMNQSAEVVTSYSPAWTPNMASCDVTPPDPTPNDPSDNVVFKNLYATSGWKKGMTTQSEVWVNGVRKKWTTMTPEHDGAEAAPYPINPRIKDTTVNDSDGNHRGTSISYVIYAPSPNENIALPQGIIEYKDAPTVPLRTTITEYDIPNRSEYASRRIIGLPKATYLYEGGVASSNLRSKVGYVYDEPNNLSDTFLAALPSPAAQHEGTNYGASFMWRGNANRVMRYEVDQSNGALSGSYIENRTGYNATGTVAYAKDGAGHKTAISYTDSFFQSINRTNANPQLQLQTFAYPTTVTDPDNFTATSVYNYDMGAAIRTRTPLPNVTTSQSGPEVSQLYDSAGRVLRTTNSVNAARTRWVYPASMGYVNIFTMIESGVESYASNLLDGAGRTRGTARYLPPPTDDKFSQQYAGNYTTQFFDYDLMGRLARQSNPTEAAGAAGWPAAGEDAAASGGFGRLYTTQTYDWKGRPLVTTKPKLNPNDPNEAATTIEVDYGGCGCAGGEVVTEAGETVMLPPQSGSGAWSPGRRRQKTYSDVLGRAWKSESLNRDGTPYRTVVTEYAASDQVKAVKEYKGAATSDGSCPTATCQATTMAYDGYGRLQSRRAPEQTASTTYSYDADDVMLTMTDPRGVVTSYGFTNSAGYTNKRHLLNSISYSNAPSGVPVPTQARFEYDAAGNRTSQSDGTGSVAYHYDNLSRLDSETRTFTSLGGASYPLTYSYNLADQLTSLTDPTGARIDYEYNRAGRLKAVTGTPYGSGSVTQYASGMKYRAWGAIKEMGYGNGLKLEQGFDSRLQVKSYRVGLSNAQPGAGDRALSDYEREADGRIKTAYDRTDANFDRSYAYDHVGRLFDAHTASSAYFESFTYDEFDHMTRRGNGSWRHFDTTISQYQNNRNTSTTVWPPSFPSCCPPQPVVWAYDSAGNVTHDHNKEYTYDASGQKVTVFETTQDGTLTNKLWIFQDYDAGGERVKRVEKTQTNSGPFSFTTAYYVRSSVLKNKVVTELNENGAKRHTFIHAGDILLAQQKDNQVRWMHIDPVTRSSRETTTDGSVVERREFDPLDNDVPLQDPDPPESTPDYDYAGNYQNNGNPYDGPSGCMVDGQPLPCEFAMRQLAFGTSSGIGGGAGGGSIAGGYNVWVDEWEDYTQTGDGGYFTVDRGNGNVGYKGSGGTTFARNVSHFAFIQTGNTRTTVSQTPQKAPLDEYNQRGYEATKDTADAKLKKDKYCRQYLRSHGINPDALAKTLGKQQPFDALTSELTARQAGLVPQKGRNRYARVQVSEVMIRENGVAATGIYTKETRYDTYFFTEGITAGTLIHEALHSHFRLDDLGLATKLGLREQYLSSGSSGVITDALEKAGCNDGSLNRR